MTMLLSDHSRAGGRLRPLWPQQAVGRLSHRKRP